MAARRNPYPRATTRKILKAHAEKNVGKSVDALVFLDYISFMDALMQNAERKAKESGEKHIAPRDIRKMTTTTLRKYKG